MSKGPSIYYLIEKNLLIITRKCLKLSKIMKLCLINSFKLTHMKTEKMSHGFHQYRQNYFGG